MKQRTSKQRTSMMLRWLIVGLTSSVTIPTMATNFGSSGELGTWDGDGMYTPDTGVFLRPDSNFIVVQRNLEQTIHAPAVDFAVWEDYAEVSSLSVNTYADTGCGVSTQKVCVYDDLYGNVGLDGWNQCSSGLTGSHPNKRCKIGHVKFNQSGNVNDLQTAKMMACHELGHSLGLRHTTDPDSCMQDPFDERWLTGHDVDHLNANY